ncbi:hypothetical protein ACFL56_00695 [Candidatus Margulisiibacteriota bacterium]
MTKKEAITQIGLVVLITLLFAGLFFVGTKVNQEIGYRILMVMKYLMPLAITAFFVYLIFSGMIKLDNWRRTAWIILAAVLTLIGFNFPVFWIFAIIIGIVLAGLYK